MATAVRKRVIVADSKSKIKNAARKIKHLRDEAKVLGDEVKELQTRLLELMGTTKTVRVDMEDGTPVNVTVVRGTKVNIDENGLKKALGASMWDKVTTKSLDMKKLQAYIASGEIDPMVVANVSKETAIAPYVTVK